MREKSYLRALGAVLLAALPLLLSGCSSALMDPKGQVGEEQRVLIITAFVLMLIVVIPVIVMTLLFAYRYRESNKDATYKPNWAHSTAIEVVVWFIPCVIIAVLAVLTWITSHSLDPFKPLETDSDKPPVVIQAVSLDWKWVFIYPEQNIATVNEITFPANRPVEFQITSGTVMNAFWIPTLGSQIYAMAGMDSRLNLIADEQGTFEGRSSNYSGAGFSEMTFKAHAVSEDDYQNWITKVKASDKTLSYKGNYQELAEPSEENPVQYFSSVSPNLYNNILDGFRKGVEDKGEHGEVSNSEHGERVSAEAVE
ncbi:ubiquinol oxidase subunit II [Marinobacter koreensis]|uniref:Ubiquinol oxidase subunit 2 n=1 Tax=Marinobacter koreensis TaxID=335974 RepID=A0ABW0RNH0_9GAMM|nr:ubiquinol oxidase subunit II [Marinobacter koreensis]MCK7549572.1 ubiquinol oxidase subunit II [Marinobacter koreensis]MDX1817213.1 ubiquinol oxidase subunit II [Marinobacter sp.]